MVLNRTIQIRLTKAQYDRIKGNAELKGFETLSGFLRHVGLAQDELLHQRVKAIHDHLLGHDAKPRKKHKPNPAAEAPA